MWIFKVVFLGVLIVMISILVLSNQIHELRARQVTSSNITIDHIDKDGTIWINIHNNLYYLYINDNGVQKKLEMK